MGSKMLILKWEVVHYGDYWRAVKIWNDVYQHTDPGRNLMMFLGIHNITAVPNGFQMPEHAARKLRMLLGPHAQTIIKAWYAKHGE